MKKIFSVLLTVALLLSAVAFPAAVSAAGEAADVYFVCEKETVYPDDEITVKLMAKATSADAFDILYADVLFAYDEAVLTLDEETKPANVYVTNPGEVAYFFGDGIETKTITTDGTVLAELTFTVADTPGSATTLTIAKEKSFPSLVLTDSTSQATVTPQNLPISFTANSATVQYYNGTEFVALPQSNYTHTDAQGIIVKATKAGNVGIAIAGPEGFVSSSVDLTAENGATLNVAGEYTITVTPVGGEVVTYTFTLSLYQVDARLDIATPDNTTGYAPGATINLPVVISGLGDAKASIVTFTLDYDENYLTLADNALLTLEGDTAIYNEAGLAANNKGNGTLTTLDFTVNTAITTYGTTVVTIAAQDLALETTTVNPTATPIVTNTGAASVTIVPAESTAFATLSGQKEAYTNEAYNITVAPVAGATVKYFTSETKIEDEINAEEAYATATAVTDNTIAIADMKYYYVVAGIGTDPVVYSYIGEIAGMYDNVAPVLPEIEAQVAWAQTRTIDVTATATGAAISKYHYHIDGVEEFTETTASITIESTTAKIYVKVDDEAGNTSAVKEYTINVDTTAPDATLTNNGRVEGGVELAITASDANSGVKAVELYNGENKVTDITLTDGSATYKATAAGSYTVKVTDNSGEEGNTFTTDAVDVTITVATLKPVQAALYANGTVAAGLVSGASEDAAPNNGTFMYVKLAKPADDPGYTTTYELNGEEIVFDAEATEYVITSPAAKTTYVLTVTTTNNDDSTDSKTAYYKFTIASTVYEMASVDSNAYYNAFDYANLVRVTKSLAEGAAADVSTDTAFAAGLLSADVNADMKITAADAAEVLQAIKAVKYAGIYEFNIMNSVKDTTATLQ